MVSDRLHHPTAAVTQHLTAPISGDPLTAEQIRAWLNHLAELGVDLDKPLGARTREHGSAVRPLDELQIAHTQPLAAMLTDSSVEWNPRTYDSTTYSTRAELDHGEDLRPDPQPERCLLRAGHDGDHEFGPDTLAVPHNTRCNYYRDAASPDIQANTDAESVTIDGETRPLFRHTELTEAIENRQI